jgi:uncharacterized protein YdeI (YjbR/CyaY-like superfamily)
MPPPNPNLDARFREEVRWHDEFEALRALIRSFPLTEDLKWYQPCYTLNGKNVVLIHGFKEYCAVMFIKGALLKDAKQLLATPGGHQSARQLRFTGLREIAKMKPVLKAYIQEAIEIENSGLKVKFKKTSDYQLPDEFKTALDKSPALRKAFYALTPGRQRGYIYHFSQPKLPATRLARVEKCTPQILNGKGFND